MEEGPRFFTVEEANGLVGALEIEFGRVARIRSELGPLIQSLGAELATELLQEKTTPPPGREEEARRLGFLAGEIAAAVERMNAMGCLVKDLEAGLVDFYAVQDDQPVFLCWQFGEPAVSHWHALDEGFAGRKPIEGVETRPPPFMN
jgi:hypothetical protein